MQLTQFRNAALSMGVAFSRCVPDVDVRNFINRFHPVTTRFDLVRLGGRGDGGYLVPDDLETLAACFSPGVDVTSRFEAALAERGIPCYLADGSVDKAPVEHPLFAFEKKYLGVRNDDRTMTMDHWVRACAPEVGDLILQMDIEGAEWPIFLNVSDEVLSRFRIIVVELHHLENMFIASDMAIFESALSRLFEAYHVVHIHPNNVCPPVAKRDIVVPRLMEVTLLRKDRAEATGFANTFPNPLDEPNVTWRPDMALPRGWSAE